MVCGNQHWQYMPVHPGTGVGDYSCGPTSDKPAGGWQQEDYRKNYHKFLDVKGVFLSGTRESGAPSLTFGYHAVDGSVRYEDVRRAE